MTTAIEPVTETAPAPVEAAPAEGAPEAGSAAPAGTPATKQFDPEALPAEIKGYVTKQREAAATEAAAKYADYERHRAAAQEWEGVRNDPRFQQWAEGLRKPAPAKPFEVSDEAFAAILSGDKGKFQETVMQAAQHLLKEQVAPQLERVNQHNEFTSKVTELQQTVAKYPDFKELDKRGLIEPLIRKYPGLSFEDAYKLAKHETINEEADRRARGIVDGKKKATVERPGVTTAAKGARVVAKNREEAMNMVAEAIRAGRPVPEFDEIGD
jgi:hypothetical protein